MSQRCLFFAFSVMAGMLLPASGQELPITLTWKWQKGKSLYLETTTHTKQTMKVLGMDVNQSQTETFCVRWTPEKQEGKNWIVKQKIEGVKLDIDIGGERIVYDSAKATHSDKPLVEFFKTWVGSESRLTVTPDMRVLTIEGREGRTREDELHQMLDPASVVVLGRPIKKGDTWTREKTLSMGPIGRSKMVYRCIYAGKQGDLAKINIDATLTFTKSTDDDAGFPFTIKEADLKATRSAGTILFNTVKGRLERSNMNLTLRGNMKIDIGGMTAEVELLQQQDTTARMTDTNSHRDH